MVVRRELRRPMMINLVHRRSHRQSQHRQSSEVKVNIVRVLKSPKLSAFSESILSGNAQKRVFFPSFDSSRAEKL